MPKSRGRKPGRQKPRKPSRPARSGQGRGERLSTAVELPPEEHPDVLALLNRARKSETASTPRKHHLVPASYLKRWAEDGRIRVTEVNNGHTYLTAPEKAARETDYYRVESEDIDPEFVPPLLFETFFSYVEGDGKQAIDQLLLRPALELDPELRATFARYMALQRTRGHAFRQERRKTPNDLLKISYEHVTEEGIRLLMQERGMEVTDATVEAIRTNIEDLQSGDLWIQPQDAAVVGQAVKATEYIGEYLLYREWLVYRTPPVLVTCDEPVVIIGGPGFRRTEHAGIGNAGIIIFPLAPDAVLVMPRPDLIGLRDGELDHAETAELNREILGHAARWAFERPSRNVAARIQVPPVPEATVTERRIATTKRGDEIIRTYRPTRWANTDDPPNWPVAKWWDALRQRQS